MIEFNGDVDHVQLLLDIHPNIMPSKLVNNLKTVTSRLLRKEFSAHLQEFYSKPVLWTRGYCLLTNEDTQADIIKQYIKKQQMP